MSAGRWCSLAFCSRVAKVLMSTVTVPRRAVEELLHLGADPSLVLEDGVAAVHLAARARHPRALHCLRILLRRGADPNAR